MRKRLADITLEDLPEDPSERGRAIVILVLRSMPYPVYLRTAHWNAIRTRRLQENSLCQLCRKRTAREVHHITYENRGCEMMGDLMSLCSPCHHDWHSKWRYIDPPDEVIYTNFD